MVKKKKKTSIALAPVVLERVSAHAIALYMDALCVVAAAAADTDAVVDVVVVVGLTRVERMVAPIRTAVRIALEHASCRVVLFPLRCTCSFLIFGATSTVAPTAFFAWLGHRVLFLRTWWKSSGSSKKRRP